MTRAEEVVDALCEFQPGDIADYQSQVGVVRVVVRRVREGIADVTSADVRWQFPTQSIATSRLMRVE